MANTYEEIWTEVYNIIGEETTATVLDLTTLVKPKINIVEEQICNGLMYNPVSKEFVTAWNLRFLMKTVGKNLVTQRELTADAASWAATIYFDTTGYDSNWYVFLAWQVVTHTWKTATSITTCTGLDVGVTTGTKWAVVRQAYLIPTASVDTVVVKDISNDVDIKYIDYRDDRKPTKYYSIYPNNETADKSFLVFFGTWEEQIRLIYQEWYTALSADSDESNLPWEWGIHITARIVAWLCMIDTNYDYKRWVVVLDTGIGNLKSLYAKYARINKDFKKKIQTSTYPSY